MGQYRLRMQWIVEVTDESALRDHGRSLVDAHLVPHELAGEVADAASADATRSLIEIASRQLLAGTADVPGLAAGRLLSEPG